MRSWLRVASLTGLMACGAGWHRQDVAEGSLEPSQQVQVFRQGRVLQWHAVVVAPENVSGISFLQPIKCDSCRASIPRASVDSIRFGDPLAGFWKTFGLVVGSMAVFCAVYCIREGGS